MWNVYPPNSGAVPGSQRLVGDLNSFHREFGSILDRIGDEAGSHLYALVDGTPSSFEARSLPADALELPYHEYRVTEQWPWGTDGWNIEVSVVAPWFGRAGGARQVLFIDTDRSMVTVEELL